MYSYTCICEIPKYITWEGPSNASMQLQKTNLYDCQSGFDPAPPLEPVTVCFLRVPQPDQPPRFCLAHSVCASRVFFATYLWGSLCTTSLSCRFLIYCFIIWWRTCTRYGVPVPDMATCGFFCNFPNYVVSLRMW